MQITPDKLKQLQQHAQTRVETARDKISNAFKINAPPAHVQVATFKAIQLRPDLRNKYQKQVGAEEWARYETKMQELEKTIGGQNAVQT